MKTRQTTAKPNPGARIRPAAGRALALLCAMALWLGTLAGAAEGAGGSARFGVVVKGRSHEAVFSYEDAGDYASVSIAGTYPDDLAPRADRAGIPGSETLEVLEAWTVDGLAGEAALTLTAEVTALPADGAALSLYSVGDGALLAPVLQDAVPGGMASVNLNEEIEGLAVVRAVTPLAEGEVTLSENLTLAGILPQGAVADAIAAQGLPESVDGAELLAAWDIRIYADEARRDKGILWTPEGGLSARVDAAAIAGARAPRAYRLQDGALVPAESAILEDGGLSFAVNACGVYAVAGVLDHALTADVGDYSVCVSYDSAAGIPEGATLAVSEADLSDSEADAAFAADGQDIVFYRRFLDIGIEADGEAVEPAAPVEVAVRLADVDSSDFIEVVRLADGDAQPQAASLNADGEICFETQSLDSFGFGGVAQEVAAWSTDMLSVSVLGTSSEAAPEYAEESVVLEEGLDLLEAYTVSGDEQLWLNVERTADIELGELESVAVYGVENGQVVQPLAEDLAAGETLSVSLEESEGFVLVKDTGLRRKALEAEDVVVEGMVPKDAALVVESVDAAPQLPEDVEAIAGYSISIVNGEDTWQPEEAVKVEVTCADAAQALAEGYGVELWRMDGDGESQQVDFDLDGETLVFDAQDLPEYAVVRTVLEQTISTSDGNTYEITATYDRDAGIPMRGTALLVSEILEGDEGYDAYIAASADKLGAKAENMAFSRVFDIKIVDESDPDHVYEPSGEVVVSIALADSALEDYANVGVLHFVEEEGFSADAFDEDTFSVYEMDADVDGEAVAFTTDSFSVYVVAGYTMETVIEAGDGNTYRIAVTFTEDAELPDDAALKVDELTGDVCEGYLARAAAALRAYAFDYARIFDITIVDGEGAEYQPAVPVRVDVSLLDAQPAEEGFSVLHFAGEEETPELMAAETEETVVSFDTDGFSAYAIVQGPDRYPYSAGQTVQSLAELARDYEGQAFNISYGTSPMYCTNALNGNKAFKETGNVAQASSWYFESAGAADTYYIYTLVGNDKLYMCQNSGREMKLDSAPLTAFELSEAAQAKFWFKVLNQNLWFQHSNGGLGMRLWTDNDNETNSQLTITYATGAIPDDYYRLDGMSFGLMNWNYGVSGRAMMAASSQDGTLDAKTLMVMAKQDSAGQEHLFVPSDSEITQWTFESAGSDLYYLKADVEGVTKYLRVDEGQLFLVDTKDTECLLQVVPGTGAHKGQIYLNAGNKSITYNGNAVFGTGGDAGSEWLYLVEESEYTEDYFKIYSASKVSVSKVDSGDSVIVYTRVWNDEKARYEFFAIDDAGGLVQVYESGDTIQWIGNTALNNLLWKFVEYYWEGTTDPNYYYDLKNDFSENFIAPRMNGNQVLSPQGIGINLNGRRNGQYYSSILAWDQAAFAFSGLKVDNGVLVSCPMNEADDFYFAIVQDIPVDDDLITVTTVDNNPYGIKMRMQNFPTRLSMSDFLGNNVGGMGTALHQGLLSTNLGSDGYPTVPLNGNRSLAGLFNNPREVNHLFIASTYHSSGYYEYDSSQNFASLGDREGGDFTVYQEIASYDSGGDKPTLKHGQFFPYNDITAGYFASINGENLYSATAEELPESDPRKYEKLYDLAHGKAADCFFGMEIEASFTQTPNGLDAWGHDIIYEFTGDDDFWLYVDGELIIDLGGIHSAVAGSVNYATGAVEVNGQPKNLRQIFEANYKERKPNATTSEVNAFLAQYFDEGSTIFRPNSTHTMRIFYMERGASASNLHMRFNLASVQPGHVLLSKKLEGVDEAESQEIEFAYQIYYRTEGAAEQLLQQSDTQIQVTYKDSINPVPYKQSLAIGGNPYQSVFLLKPGEVADIHFPNDTMEYRIVECGLDDGLYEQVGIEEFPESDIQRTLHGSLYDYGFALKEVNKNPRVTFVNTMDEGKLGTLEIKKKLYKPGEQSYEPIQHSEDDQEFEFRLYLASGLSGELALTNIQTYHVKDDAGYYCYWNSGEQKMKRYMPAYDNYDNVPDDAKEQLTFHTSIYGAISNVPNGYTVEVRGLLPGTQYKVDERPANIPDGYSFWKYTKGEEIVTDATVGITNATAGITGSIVESDTERVIVNNIKGFGLRVNKTWSDEDYMAGREDTYFAVYALHADDNQLHLVRDTETQKNVQRLAYGDSTLYWYYDVLPDPAAQDLSDLEKYCVREVCLENPQVDGQGNITYTSCTPVNEDAPIQLYGWLKGQTEDDKEQYTYIVHYSVDEDEDTAPNIRLFNVENDRAGVVLKKTNWSDNPLAGAVFTLTLPVQDGDDIVFGPYTSDAQGRITEAYLIEGQEYTLTETQAPDGHYGLQQPVTVQLTGGTVLATPHADDAGCCVVTQEAGDAPATVTIKNRAMTFQVVKLRGEDLDHLDTTEELEGVLFALYRVKTVGGMTAIDTNPMDGFDTLRTDSDGVVPDVNEDLARGSYELHEKEVPFGCQSLSLPQIRFTIHPEGSVTLDREISGVRLDKDTATPGKVAYTMQVLNHPAVGLTIKKQVIVEANEEIPDQAFEFTLVNVERQTYGTQYAWEKHCADGTIVSTQNGATPLSTKRDENTFKLKNGEYITIEVPKNKEITIVETGADKDYRTSWSAQTSGQSGQSTEVRVTLEDHDTVIVTNSKTETVPVTVKKTLSDPLATGPIPFEFTVDLRDATGQALGGCILNSAEGIETDARGTATFTLQATNGSEPSEILLYVPSGSTLTVTEETPATETIQGEAVQVYDVTVRKGQGSEQDAHHMPLPNVTAPATIHFTNTRKTANVTVSKAVNGSAADLTKPFAFTASLYDTEYAPLKYDDAFDDGSGENEFAFNLTNGGTQQLTVPIGARLVIAEQLEESDVGKYTVSSAGTEGIGAESDQTFTIDAVPAAGGTVTFTNTRTAADLTITKTIAGDMGDRAAVFRFTLAVDGAEPGAEYSYTAGTSSGTLTLDEHGQASFELGDGGSITIEKLPTGATITVTEQNGSYQPAWTLNGGAARNSNTAAFVLDGDGELTFTNELNAVSPTGYRSDARPFQLMLLAAGLLLALAVRRRRDTEA